ncbi:high affinity nitrate transporter 2.4 [Spatholobus suberectus]|nr:high affinity nitrate transporter 2.4 [Spatholobus suberectus]
MFRLRGLLHRANAFTCHVVLSFILFWLAGYELCSLNGIKNPSDYDACASFERGYDLGSSDATVSDSSLVYGFPSALNNFENVCPNSHSFCFPSLLSGFSHKEKIVKEASLGESGSQYNSPFCVELAQDSRQTSNESWSSEYGVFRLLNGGVISCSLNTREGVNEVPPLQTEVGCKDDISSCGGSSLKQKTTRFWSKNSEISKSNSFDGSVSPNVRIGPTVLDWGQKYLYSSSAAFLTVTNTCNDSILHLYEPFSTDLQFYPCNFSEVSLRPGESALICFVFFPKSLGLSSSSLILQTNSGGFIVEAKGYATESPFGIQPLSGVQISPGGRLSKNFSLFNPFDETLYVEEITAWISISSGHNYVETEAICRINDFQVFDAWPFPTIKDRLVVKSGQFGSPIIAIRPHRNWDIAPHGSENLMEMDIMVGFEGKIFGAFCLHLLRSSQDTSDTIMVPIEAEVDSHSAYDTVGIFISATLEGLATCDSGEIAITISLRNDAPYVLSFVKVIEVSDTQLFHIKYKEGLLLFPGTVTQVGIIYCSHLHLDFHDFAPKVSSLRENCKLLILTNDSTSPLIEIPCEDILYICFEHQGLRPSSVQAEGKSEHTQSDNTRAGPGYMGRSMQLRPNVKVLETEDVDELVLANWKSQGITSGMSVLEDREVLFPMIQVGSYVSRWITVKNPSQHPVVMQLILNSGEIINECRGLDDLLHPSSSSNLVLDEGATPKKYGFSVPDNALTEAYVHPHDHVTLGPIIFYPSDRCGWSGSALIRNNLSGVEWIPLRGYGGLFSLVLFERSEHVDSVDFDLKMPKTLNFSLPYTLLHMKEVTSACSQHLVKELYAKNTGDLPLEVKSIRVSGRECGLDGFKILFCKGFALEPGESIKLLISYQTDFSAAVVHRDLELALATGIFLLPMKASFPYDMLSSCNRSMYWMRLKKSLLGFLLVASLIFLIFCFIFPQNTALGFLDFCFKSDDDLVHSTIKNAGKTPLLQQNQRKSKLSMSCEMNHLMEASSDRCSYGQGSPSEQEISQHLTETSENHKQTSHALDIQSERKLSSTAVQSSDPMKESQLVYLTVKTGKEKGRRKRRKSLGAKLAALSEVSSSQSGNSTPSSPLSPTATATPKCNWPLSPDVEQPLEALSSMTPVAPQHSVNDQASVTAAEANILKPAFTQSCSNNVSSQVPHSASRSATSLPVQIPCATSPIPASTFPSPLGSKSTVNLHARAPGSQLHNQTAVQAREAGLANEYTYDIWGDHFSGLNLLVPKNVTSIKSSPVENNFDSFFVRGPQTLVTNSQEG